MTIAELSDITDTTDPSKTCRKLWKDRKNANAPDDSYGVLAPPKFRLPKPEKPPVELPT